MIYMQTNNNNNMLSLESVAKTTIKTAPVACWRRRRSLEFSGWKNKWQKKFWASACCAHHSLKMLVLVWRATFTHKQHSLFFLYSLTNNSKPGCGYFKKSIFKPSRYQQVSIWLLRRYQHSNHNPLSGVQADLPQTVTSNGFNLLKWIRHTNTHNKRATERERERHNFGESRARLLSIYSFNSVELVGERKESCVCAQVMNKKEPAGCSSVVCACACAGLSALFVYTLCRRRFGRLKGRALLLAQSTSSWLFYLL